MQSPPRGSEASGHRNQAITSDLYRSVAAEGGLPVVLDRLVAVHHCSFSSGMKNIRLEIYGGIGLPCPGPGFLLLKRRCREELGLCVTRLLCRYTVLYNDRINHYNTLTHTHIHIHTHTPISTFPHISSPPPEYSPLPFKAQHKPDQAPPPSRPFPPLPSQSPDRVTIIHIYQDQLLPYPPIGFKTKLSRRTRKWLTCALCSASARYRGEKRGCCSHDITSPHFPLPSKRTRRPG